MQPFYVHPSNPDAPITLADFHAAQNRLRELLRDRDPAAFKRMEARARRRQARAAAAKFPAVIAKIQASHDRHTGGLNTSASHVERQAAHRQRMATKAALLADPAARAAQLAEINAPAHQKHRLAALNALALDLAAKKNLPPAEAV